MSISLKNVSYSYKGKYQTSRRTKPPMLQNGF